MTLTKTQYKEFIIPNDPEHFPDALRGRLPEGSQWYSSIRCPSWSSSFLNQKFIETPLTEEDLYQATYIDRSTDWRGVRVRIPFVPQTEDKKEKSLEDWYQNYKKNGGDFTVDVAPNTSYMKNFYIHSETKQKYILNTFGLRFFMDEASYHLTREDAIKHLKSYVEKQERETKVENLEEWYENYVKNGGTGRVDYNSMSYDISYPWYVTSAPLSYIGHSLLMRKDGLHPEDYFDSKENGIRHLKAYVEKQEKEQEQKNMTTQANTNAAIATYNSTDWHDFVDSVLDNWTTLDKKFTAYDVSKKVQEDMKSDGLPFVRHVDMRTYIHDEMCEVIGYERVYENFGTYSAFQYRPTLSKTNFTKAINDYKATGQVVSQSVKARIASQTVAGPAPKTWTRIPDARGSITIPKSLVEELGWKKGQRVYTIVDVDGVHVLAQKQTQNKSSYLVDKNLNVRLTKKILGQNSSFKVQRVGNEVVVN